MGNIRSTASIMIFPLLLLGYALDDADGCQMSATLCRDDGKGKVHAFNLHSAVDRVVGAGFKKKLRLTSSTGLPDSESTISTDSAKLYQVLTNLIQKRLNSPLRAALISDIQKGVESLSFM